MRIAILTLLLLAAGAHVALADEERSALITWLTAQGIDERVVREIAAFDEKDPWPEEYPAALAGEMRDRILADLRAAEGRIGDGGSFVRVDYLEPADFSTGRPETSDERGRKFEKGFIRTEQVARFPAISATPAEALAAFVDPEFRRQTSSRLEEIREVDDLSCVRTKGMWGLLDPTWTCNRITLYEGEDFAAEHSQVVSNPGDEDFQPIFFKESVKVFFDTGDGLALYYINYTRSASLGGLKKRLGRGRIEDAQRDRAESLRVRLAGE